MTDPYPRIVTRRLILRRPEMDDFAAFAAFMASDRAAFVGGPRPDRRDAWRSFAHIAGMWLLRGVGPFVAVARDTGAPVGMAGPWQPFDWPEPEIAWSVWSSADEGRGYAFEAARAAIAHATDTLGWATAVHYIDPDNARSIALAERLGSRPDPDAARPAPDCLVYRIEPPGLLRETDGIPTQTRHPITSFQAPS